VSWNNDKTMKIKTVTLIILSMAIILSSCNSQSEKEGSYTIQLKGKEYHFHNSYSEQVVYPESKNCDMRFLSGKAGFTADEIGQEDATLYISINQQRDGDYELVDTEEFLKTDETRNVAYLVVGIDNYNLEVRGSYFPPSGTINVKVINGVCHFNTTEPIVLIREEDEERATLTIVDLYTNNILK